MERKLLKGPSQCLHDLLRGGLFQLCLDRASERRRCVFESMEHHPADSGATQLKQDRRGGGSEFSVNQEGQGGEEQSQPFDAVSSCLATQKRIHHGHFDRLGADGVHHVGPANPRYPFIAVWINRAKSDQAFGRNCCQEQMSQIGPYLSQMGPNNRKQAIPDWRCIPASSTNAI